MNDPKDVVLVSDQDDRLIWIEGRGLMFALLTDQGTSASETALCAEHRHDPKGEQRARDNAAAAGDVRLPYTSAFADCSGHPDLRCLVCGRSA